FSSFTLRRHPTSPLFPYTTLFRSRRIASKRSRMAVRAARDRAFFPSFRSNRTTAVRPCRSSVSMLSGHLADHADDARIVRRPVRSEEHTSELQSRENLVCRLLLEK